MWYSSFSTVLIMHTLAVIVTNPTDGASAQRSSLVCLPSGQASFEVFPLPCEENGDCRVMGGRYVCCARPSGDKACAKGVAPTPTSTPPALTPAADDPAPRSSSTTSSRPVPKTSPTTAKEERSTFVSAIANLRTTASSAIATASSAKSSTAAATEPTVIALPTAKSTKTAKTEKKATSAPEKKSTAAASKLSCPRMQSIASFNFLAVRCTKRNDECAARVGVGFICCDGRCVRGVPPPLPQPSHAPFLGVIPRECPAEPLGELLFELTVCESDADCWPRVCCPDGQAKYCRTGRPALDAIPAGRQLASTFREATAYVQCSPPPEVDLFPRPCSSAFDCLPNLCCQEAGKRHCRPPQRSLLALLAGVTQVPPYTP